MYEDISQRLEDATEKAENASGIMHDVANGAENTTVTTESGQVPTIAEFLRIKDEEINTGADNILAGAQQAATEAETAKDESETILGQMGALEQSVQDNTTLTQNNADQVATNTQTVSDKTQFVVDAQVDVTTKAQQVSDDAAQVAQDKSDAADSSLLAQMWAVGSNPDSTEPSDTNNSKYWSDRAAQFATGALLYGGLFTPTVGTPYPPVFDTDIMYLVNFTDPENTFTYTDGDLDGTTVKNGNAIIYNTPENQYEASSFVFTGVATVNGKSPDPSNNVTINAEDVDAYDKSYINTALSNISHQNLNDRNAPDAHPWGAISSADLYAVARASNVGYSEVSYLQLGLVSGISYFYDVSTQKTFYSWDGVITGDITAIGSTASDSLTITVDAVDYELITPQWKAWRDEGDVRGWGAVSGIDSGVDNSPFIVAALTAGIALITEHYMSDDVVFPNDCIMRFQGGGAIQKIATDSSTYYLLDAEGKENIEIHDPVIIGDRDEHITTPNEDNYDGFNGEWGMGINITNSKNVYVYNPNISKCWGDGIYLGNRDGGNINENIHIKGNIVIDGCRRQGISIVAGDGVYIDSFTAKNINGTAPMRAIDIEPNTSNDHLTNIQIGDVTADNCYGVVYVITRGGELDVQIGDVYGTNLRGTPISFAYSEINDSTDANETGNGLNSDNSVTIGNVHIDKSIGSVIDCSRTLSSLYPRISIGDVYVDTIERLIEDDQDDTKNWNVSRVLLDRDYGYKKLGDISIGDVTIGNLIGFDEIRSFVGLDRLSLSATGATLQNISIKSTRLLNSDQKILNGYTSFDYSINCDYGVSGLKILTDGDNEIEKGVNVSTVRDLQIRESTCDAIVIMQYGSVRFNLLGVVANSYTVNLNGSPLEQSEIIYGVRDKIVTIKRDVINKIINIYTNNSTTIIASQSRNPNPLEGEMMLDRVLGIPIWYNGTDWVNSSGVTV